MATSQKLTDHFLTCTVCTEVFNDPCSLDCNHTFCRKCLVSFTKTQPDAIKAKSLPCPICRKWTKAANPGKPVDQWADDRKPLFLMQGLLDSFGPSSKDTTHCTYCKEVGETTLATGWCSVCDDALCDKCTQMHRRIPATRNHDVANLSGEVKITRRRKVTCKEHTHEYVEFHCKDCKKAVCHKCCILYHRKCESVVSIESEMTHMKTHLAKKKKEMTTNAQETTRNLEETKANVTALTNSSSEVETEIKSTCNKLVSEIRQKEKQLLAKLRSVTEERTGDLKAAIKAGEMAVQMYQQQAELIDQAVKSDCEMSVYEMYQSSQSGSVECGELDMKNKRRGVKIVFRSNSDKVANAVKNQQLGEIDVIYKGGINLKGKPVLHHKIDDGQIRWANDVKVLDVDGINVVVVCDMLNSCMTSFYSRDDQQCNNELILSNGPWSLTQLKHNQVAVTVPAGNQILIVEVNPDLTILSTVKTDKAYHGITAVSYATIAASSIIPPSLDILDVKGTVLKSILPTSQDLVENPQFLCTANSGNILVTDQNHKSVLCLTPQGDIVFNYSPQGTRSLSYPQGIVSTNTGAILVVEYGSSRVIHLTEVGQFVRELLTTKNGLSKPSGIDLDANGNIYVTQYDTGCINVYKMSN